MTPLNTIIEEEKKAFDKQFSDSRYATARAQQFKDFLTTAMQRAYEARGAEIAKEVALLHAKWDGMADSRLLMEIDTILSKITHKTD